MDDEKLRIIYEGTGSTLLDGVYEKPNRTIALSVKHSTTTENELEYKSYQYQLQPGTSVEFPEEPQIVSRDVSSKYLEREKDIEKTK